jgi:predicted signal transduction protein with EAL and GGDEF domain
MAHRFTQALRTSAHPPRGTADTVARLSGDEFVVLLDSISAVEHVLEAAEWMKDAISQNVAIDQIELVLEESIRQVAEGIESYDQMMHLKELDCDYGQGYYFAKPLPAGENRQLVKATNE